jgi:hypothetical protein
MNTVIRVIRFPFISIEKIINIFSVKKASDFSKVEQAITFQEEAIQMRLMNTPFL